jgi:class 3 adenylate cyclase
MASPRRVLASILITDIVGSTALALRLGDERWLALLDEHDAVAAREIERHGGRLVRHLGDGALAAFPAPAAAIAAAESIRDCVAALGMELRSGVHVGECQTRGLDLRGIAVHVGARIAELAAPGEVLVSQPVRDLVLGSGVSFAARGVHALKGLGAGWALFAAEPSP